MIRLSLDPGSPHVILDIKPGDDFAASKSQDGAVWTLHDTTVLNTAIFDHVQVASRFAELADVGDVGVAGALDSNGTDRLIQRPPIC